MPRRVPGPEPDVDAGQQIVTIAVDEIHPMLDRSLQRHADVRRINDLREMCKALRQRQRLVARQQLALLDMDARLGEFADRAQMVEVRMGDDDVAHCLRRHAQLGKHAQRRNPARNAELERELGFVALPHETGVDEHVLLPAPRQHKGEGQIDHPRVVHPAHQPHPRLVRVRVLKNKHFPAIVVVHSEFLACVAHGGRRPLSADELVRGSTGMQGKSGVAVKRR